jgi:hypothetical protein
MVREMARMKAKGPGTLTMARGVTMWPCWATLGLLACLLATFWISRRAMKVSSQLARYTRPARGQGRGGMRKCAEGEIFILLWLSTITIPPKPPLGQTLRLHKWATRNLSPRSPRIICNRSLAPLTETITKIEPPSKASTVVSCFLNCTKWAVRNLFA